MESANCIKCKIDFIYDITKTSYRKRKYCSKNCLKSTYLNNKSRNDNDVLQLAKLRYLDKVIMNGDEECWGWKDSLKEKYGSFQISGKKFRAHRISWIVFNGKITEYICVLHKCDNPPCSNPKHLFIGNRSDNNADMVNKGRNKKFPGSLNPRALIDEDQVIEIKKLLSQKISPTIIAKQFNIPRHIVYHINYGKNWKNINI